MPHMRAGEAAEAQSASEPASTPAPTRSVTLQCRRVLFGPGTGGILPLPDLQTDVPLILDDKESDCPARRERRLTFTCRGRLTRLSITREVFSADVERVQIYDAAEARPSHINGPVIVLWMTATYADRGGSHRPFAPATLIVSQLEHDFDRDTRADSSNSNSFNHDVNSVNICPETQGVDNFFSPGKSG